MFRTALGWGLVTALLAFAGCRMCSHPYDYSGPVYGHEHQSYSTQARAGSVFEGASQTSSLPTSEYTVGGQK